MSFGDHSVLGYVFVFTAPATECYDIQAIFSNKVWFLVSIIRNKRVSNCYF